MQSQENVDEGRFPCAAGANDGDGATTRDVEVNAAQDQFVWLVGVGEGQFTDLDVTLRDLVCQACGESARRALSCILFSMTRCSSGARAKRIPATALMRRTALGRMRVPAATKIASRVRLPRVVAGRRTDGQ